MPVISPKKIRYIKLGMGGVWEQSCIEENIIRLGYESPLHRQSLNGEWDAVRDFWFDGDSGAATRHVNQIRDFYELGEEDIWITFHKRKLYWCKASKEVVELEDKSRIRKTLGSWLSTDKNGCDLRIENLDGRLTKVQGFRGTICSLDDEVRDYLVRKINGQIAPAIKDVKETLQHLKSNIAGLIKGLWWRDFEILIDLVFARSGWQRISVVGKTEKNIDLDIYSPTTRKRAFVQIKSATTSSEIREYIEIYREHEEFHEMYFVFHSSGDVPEEIKNTENVHIWGVEQVADLVVNTGLVEWLINKRS